jgi:Glucose-1-phosphate thymidylyltransferase (EC 2.7.7.24)
VSAKEHAGNFINLLGSGKEFGAKIEYTVQDEPKGVAQALSVARDFVDGDDVLLNLGDNIVLDDISKDVRSFTGGAMVFLKKVKNPSAFGVPVFNGKKIIAIEEKPKNPKSSYAVTGLYLYDNTVFDKIKRLKPSARGEIEITDVNNLYINEGTLRYSFLKKEWSDAGTFDSLFETSEMMRRIINAKRRR